jgi:hypothetical protein
MAQTPGPEAMRASLASPVTAMIVRKAIAYMPKGM